MLREKLKYINKHKNLKSQFARNDAFKINKLILGNVHLGSILYFVLIYESTGATVFNVLGRKPRGIFHSVFNPIALQSNICLYI